MYIYLLIALSSISLNAMDDKPQQHNSKVYNQQNSVYSQKDTQPQEGNQFDDLTQFDNVTRVVLARGAARIGNPRALEWLTYHLEILKNDIIPIMPKIMQKAKADKDFVEIEPYLKEIESFIKAGFIDKIEHDKVRAIEILEERAIPAELRYEIYLYYLTEITGQIIKQSKLYEEAITKLLALELPYTHVHIMRDIINQLDEKFTPKNINCMFNFKAKEEIAKSLYATQYLREYYKERKLHTIISDYTLTPEVKIEKLTELIQLGVNPHGYYIDKTPFRSSIELGLRNRNIEIVSFLLKLGEPQLKDYTFAFKNCDIGIQSFLWRYATRQEKDKEQKRELLLFIKR